VSPKKLSLSDASIRIKTEQITEGYQLTVSCERLAKNVLLGTSVDGFFSENYFDLLPGEQKTVVFKTETILDDPNQSFKAKSLVDTW
jgi:beta-mannosidase